MTSANTSVTGTGAPQSDSEETPLLQPNRQSDIDSGAATTSKRGSWPVLLLLLAIIFLTETGESMRKAPLIATLHDSLCKDLETRSSLGSNDDNCAKDPAVTKQLAFILGISSLIESIPALLLPVPYSSLADRFGRRICLLLGYGGYIAGVVWVTVIAQRAPAVPLELVWLGPAFTIIGGGPGVASAMVFAIAADACVLEHRTTIFAYIHATALLAAAVGSVIASSIMPQGLLTPQLIGICLMMGGVPMGIFLPKQPTAPPQSLQHLEVSRPDNLVDDDLGSGHIKKGSIADTLCHSYHALRQTKGAFPLLVAALLAALGQQLQIVVIQYLPVMFNITFAEANMFNALNGSVNFLTLTIVLPILTALLLRRSPTAAKKDAILTHASTLVFVAGALTLAIAPSVAVAIIGMVVFSLGICLSSLLRTMFIGLFPSEEEVFATSLKSTAAVVGGLLSGPVFSIAITLSLRDAADIRGLPFLVCAGCFTFVELMLLATRWRTNRHDTTHNQNQ